MENDIELFEAHLEKQSKRPCNPWDRTDARDYANNYFAMHRKEYWPDTWIRRSLAEVVSDVCFGILSVDDESTTYIRSLAARHLLWEHNVFCLGRTIQKQNLTEQVA